jgi:hypothetical protein
MANFVFMLEAEFESGTDREKRGEWQNWWMLSRAGKEIMPGIYERQIPRKEKETKRVNGNA